jgi:acyl carrier protein
MELDAVVRAIVTEMRLLDGGDRLRALDSLTLIELVAALENETGRDLTRMQLTRDMFKDLVSIGELLDRAR